jgi:hypothetical protein
MKNAWKWLIVFGVVFIVTLIVALLFFSGSGFGRIPMMGFRGYSTINGFNMTGGFWMMFMLIIPITLVGLAIFGVVALLQRSGNSFTQTKMHACAHCGKPVQSDWKACPYCGKKI